MKNRLGKLLCVGSVVVLAGLIGTCAKKKEPAQNLARTEESRASYAKSWDKSVAIIQRSIIAPPDTLMAGETLKERVAAKLSESRSIKTILPPSEDALRRSGLSTDALFFLDTETRGGRISVNARLAASSQAVLWEGTVEGPVWDVESLSFELARGVETGLGLTNLNPTLPKRIIYPDIPMTWLDAEASLSNHTWEKTDEAVRLYKHILRYDSTFAPAWAGLAKGYLLIINERWNDNLVWLELAKDASLRAIRHDPDYPEARVSLGQVYLGWGDTKDAKLCFWQALAESPSLAEAWAGLGRAHDLNGKSDSSLICYRTALAIDPWMHDVAVSLTMLQLTDHDYSAARGTMERAIRIDPDLPYLKTFLGLAYYYEGRFEEALQQVRVGIGSEHHGILGHAVLAMILAKMNRPDDALGELELEVKPHIGNDPGLAAALADGYAVLNRPGEAVEWLKRARILGFADLRWIEKDPNLDGLHGDDRFRELMKTWKADARKSRSGQ